MLQQVNKRGVSEIVGYILMIAIVVVISVFVYVWLKTYVPQSSLTCPDGVSVSISNYTYDCTNRLFNFTLANEGTFSIAGYFIHMANDSSQQIAAIDLSYDFIGPSPATVANNGIILSYYNIKAPGESIDMVTNGFQLTANQGVMKKLEIIPIRFVEYNGKNRLTACTNAKVSIPISCT